MTAFELMKRMSVEEIRAWNEYDSIVRTTPADYRFALIMARLDALLGVKKPDPKRYLPQQKETRKRRSPAEIKLNFDMAVAASGGQFIVRSSEDNQ